MNSTASMSFCWYLAANCLWRRFIVETKYKYFFTNYVFYGIACCWYLK